MKKPYPNKVFYKIGEVAEIVALEPYVLRYWEGEFNFKLTKSRNNQRLYQKKDIDTIVKIKTLLYEEKYTIAGAKKKLRERKKKKNRDPELTEGQMNLTLMAKDPRVKRYKETLVEVRDELKKLMMDLGT